MCVGESRPHWHPINLFRYFILIVTKYFSLSSLCYHFLIVTRDCGLTCHKPCHIRVDNHCLQTSLPNMELWVDLRFAYNLHIAYNSQDFKKIGWYYPAFINIPKLGVMSSVSLWHFIHAWNYCVARGNDNNNHYCSCCISRYKGEYHRKMERSLKSTSLLDHIFTFKVAACFSFATNNNKESNLFQTYLISIDLIGCAICVEVHVQK